jgi:NADH/F420H2 dehydrogenase subunit C
VTKTLSHQDLAVQLREQFGDAIIEATDAGLVVDADRLVEIASYLQLAPGLGFDFLNSVSGVDYERYFEVVYHLTSIVHNHSMVLKVRCYDHEKPVVPSVVSLWQAADFQEREVYDLMGISFAGHPNLERILLWEGFPGHPLRKDFLKVDAYRFYREGYPPE